RAPLSLSPPRACRSACRSSAAASMRPRCSAPPPLLKPYGPGLRSAHQWANIACYSASPRSSVEHAAEVRHVRLEAREDPTEVTDTQMTSGDLRKDVTEVRRKGQIT